MKIFVSLDREGYADGWAEVRGAETDIEAEFPEDHEFFMNFRPYKWENGVFNKDVHKEAELTRKREEHENTPTIEEQMENIVRQNNELTTMVNELAASFLMGILNNKM